MFDSDGGPCHQDSDREPKNGCLCLCMDLVILLADLLGCDAISWGYTQIIFEYISTAYLYANLYII